MLIDLFAGLTTGLINGEVVISFNIGPISFGYAGGSGYWTYIGNPDNTIFENVMLGISTAGFLIDLGQIGQFAGKEFCSEPSSTISYSSSTDDAVAPAPQRSSAIDLRDASDSGSAAAPVSSGQRSRSGSASGSGSDAAPVSSGQRSRSGSDAAPQLSASVDLDAPAPQRFSAIDLSDASDSGSDAAPPARARISFPADPYNGTLTPERAAFFEQVRERSAYKRSLQRLFEPGLRSARKNKVGSQAYRVFKSVRDDMVYAKMRSRFPFKLSRVK
jgi:hypothetical protein